MLLEGSCHCRTVRFTIESHTPQPFMWCYCSLCRKVGGGGGYAINIMGDAATLEVTGQDSLADYRIKHYGDDADEKLSSGHRFFCRECGTMLWAANDRYGDWVYPFASAIDTPLPEPAERVHMMLDFKAPWVSLAQRDTDVCFDRYPEESIESWHRQRGLYAD